VSGREPIRSYQRIFRPDRRIYHVEGRALPVPGGIPLRWLAYATAALLAVIALGLGSLTIDIGLSLGAAVAGLLVGGRFGAAMAGAGALATSILAGILLGQLDWPISLLVIPAGVATLATQATPDGRRADRFAASWLALRLAPRRRSLGRGLPATGVPQLREASLWVAPDEHAPVLRRACVRGEGTIGFAREVRVRRAGARQRRLLVREARGRQHRGELTTTALALAEGEVAEIRR
jgi:hypothetical protein